MRKIPIIFSFLMTLINKTFHGIVWHFIQLLVRRGINFVVILLLARVLLPQDFALVAMMTVFLAIGSSLMNSGFKEALIRKKDATQIDFNTAFYSNLLMGIGSYCILYGAAPWIAAFYDEERLVNLIRISAIGVIINSFIVVQNAQLHREIDFKTGTQIFIPASFLSAIISVAFAYSGFGVWALVSQSLVFSLTQAVFLWFKRRWRPSLSFSQKAFKQMYAFGYKLFLSGAINIIFSNIYIAVIAKIFDASTAGCYFFAEKIKDMIINQLIGSINTVSYSTLAKLNESEKDLKARYRKITSVVTFLLFPVMTILAVLSSQIFEGLMPAKWSAAAEYFQLLCFAGLLDPITTINLNLLKVKGRSDLYFYLEVLKKLVVVTVFLISIKFGILGILIGQIISSILTFIPNSYFLSKLIGYSIREQLSDFITNLLLSFVVAACCFYIVNYVSWEPLVEITVFGMLSITMYFFSAFLFKLNGFVLIKEMAARKFYRHI
ncbi:lipopolysaccharide biosynthesis protein [Methylomonas sp. MgM2]